MKFGQKLGLAVAALGTLGMVAAIAYYGSQPEYGVLFSDLKPDLDALLRTYLRRNGNYRSNALLHSAYVASGDPATSTVWFRRRTRISTCLSRPGFKFRPSQRWD